MSNIIVANKFGNVINLFINGNSIQKTFELKEDADEFYKLVLKAKDGDNSAFEAFMIILNKAHRALYRGILESDSNNNFYLKGFNIPIPNLLVETLDNYLDNNYPVNALINFWKLLMANPDSVVRNDLFDFLRKYNFAITDNGYFTAYKAVTFKKSHDNTQLKDYVNNEYDRIRKLKKGTNKYSIYYTGVNYITIDEKSSKELLNGNNYTLLGTVKELHQNINILSDNSSKFTDKWTKKMDITLGVPVKESRSECDANPHNACSRGLHAGTTDYAKNYASNDDVILLVLINPAKVVAVPKSDTTKLRSCEYYPCQIMKKSNDTFIPLEGSYFENDYKGYEIEELNSILSKYNKKEIVSVDEKNYHQIINSRFIDLTT